MKVTWHEGQRLKKKESRNRSATDSNVNITITRAQNCEMVSERQRGIRVRELTHRRYSRHYPCAMKR